MREETEEESEALLSGLKGRDTNNTAIVISPIHHAVRVEIARGTTAGVQEGFTDQEWVVFCPVEQHPSSAAHRERCETTVTRKTTPE